MYLGEVKFVEGRSPSETAALVLRRCLESGRQAAEAAIDAFLKRLSIKPSAFFADIDGSWTDRPFIGQHVFKVVVAAGYRGTENDLWLAFTGNIAPYRVFKCKVQPGGPWKVKGRATK